MRKIIKKIIKRFNDWLTKPLTDKQIITNHGVRYGENVDIYGHGYDLGFGALLEIGNNVTISQTTMHLHDSGPHKFMRENGTELKQIKIGNNVFIGYGSIIIPGSVIGDNVIVGAGTVVKGEVPSDSVIVGNPWKRICSCEDYINHHKERQKNAVFFDGNDYSKALEYIKEGKDVYIK